MTKFDYAYNWQRYSVVWVLHEGEPKQVKFVNLLDYAGFEYLEPDEEVVEIHKDGYLVGWKNLKQCHSEALFAATKEDLIDGHIEKIRQIIQNIEESIKKLESLK